MWTLSYHDVSHMVATWDINKHDSVINGCGWSMVPMKPGSVHPQFIYAPLHYRPALLVPCREVTGTSLARHWHVGVC